MSSNTTITTNTQLAPLGGASLDLLDRSLQRIEFITAAIGGFVIFGMMWLGVAEIFLRKAFNSPLFGQLDLIEMTMVAYAILTVSYCYRKAGHVRVDILASRLTGRANWIMELMATIVTLALIGVLLPGAWHYFQNAYLIGDSTINTGWPTWPSKLACVIGFVILIARLILEVWAYARVVIHPDGDRIAIPAPTHIIDEVD